VRIAFLTKKTKLVLAACSFQAFFFFPPQNAEENGPNSGPKKGIVPSRIGSLCRQVVPFHTEPCPLWAASSSQALHATALICCREKKLYITVEFPISLVGAKQSLARQSPLDLYPFSNLGKSFLKQLKGLETDAWTISHWTRECGNMLLMAVRQIRETCSYSAHNGTLYNQNELRQYKQNAISTSIY
jgi:hypothetical protein